MIGLWRHWLLYRPLIGGRLGRTLCLPAIYLLLLPCELALIAVYLLSIYANSRLLYARSEDGKIVLRRLIWLISGHILRQWGCWIVRRGVSWRRTTWRNIGIILTEFSATSERIVYFTQILRHFRYTPLFMSITY
jgi:hypothetical protein